MRPFAAALLLATLGAAGAGSVEVSPSSLTFKEALQTCPQGTLASITLTLGHVRISEAPGVDSDIDDANPNAQVVVLSKGSLMATATVNASKNTVSARHVSLAAHGRVACVAPG